MTIEENGFYRERVSLCIDRRSLGGGRVGYGLRWANGKRITAGYPTKRALVFMTERDALAYVSQRPWTLEG